MRKWQKRCRIVLALLVVLFCLALLIAGLVNPTRDKDWIYRDKFGMPAPCPPPKKGYWPRDCQ